jgi:hypothetical protein
MKSHTLDRSNYSPLLLARVAVGWRRLAEDERRGIVSSAHLAADLASLDAPAAILAMAGRVVQDEIHHLEVCARVLEELDPARRVSARFECAIQRPTPDETVLARTLVDRVRARQAGRRVGVRGRPRAGARAAVRLGLHRAAPRRDPPRDVRRARGQPGSSAAGRPSSARRCGPTA